MKNKDKFVLTWNIGTDVFIGVNEKRIITESGYYLLSWLWSVDYIDVNSVANMSYMFTLTGYDVATFDIGNLSAWNTGNVTNMSGMFAYAGYSATDFHLHFPSTWDVNVTNKTDFNTGVEDKVTWDLL